MTATAAERTRRGFDGNRRANELERLYRRHATAVFRYALLVLRSRADAEDVTQATFVRAYGAIRRGEVVRKPHNWLIAIAHNECCRHLSAARRVELIELDPELVPAVEADEGPTAGELRDALGELSFNQRAALVMRELEDRSYAEIAAVLGVSISAVETLLFRARRALCEQLEGPIGCDDFEALLSKQLDGELTPDERRRLRAHMRSCASCATLERQQRGRRTALRRLGAGITLPSSLGSALGGGGGGAVATGVLVGVGTKAAAVAAAALAVTGAGVADSHRASPSARAVATPATAPAQAAAARAAPAPRARGGARADSARTAPRRGEPTLVHGVAAPALVAEATALSRPAPARPDGISTAAAGPTATGGPTETGASSGPAGAETAPAPAAPAHTAAAPERASAPARVASEPSPSAGVTVPTLPSPPPVEAPARPADPVPAVPSAPSVPSVPSVPSAPPPVQVPSVPAPPVQVPSVPVPPPVAAPPAPKLPPVTVPQPPPVPVPVLPVTPPAVPSVPAPSLPTPSLPAPPLPVP